MLLLVPSIGIEANNSIFLYFESHLPSLVCWIMCLVVVIDVSPATLHFDNQGCKAYVACIVVVLRQTLNLHW